MNVAELAQTAYSTTRNTIRTDRQAELDAFSQVTSDLRRAATLGKSGFSKLVAALHANRKLWRILALDVASEGNALPRQLRAQIFYLAEFTEAHTRKVLGGDASIDALIDINSNVMRGLRSTPGAEG